MHIDLAYLPVEDRQTSLTNIHKTLAAIATAIEYAGFWIELLDFYR